jgi:hypothetical protein
MCSLEHIAPRAIKELLDELEVSRTSRKRAWEILQEIRWCSKAPPDRRPAPGKKTIDAEGRIVKDGVRRALQDRQKALTRLSLLELSRARQGS